VSETTDQGESELSYCPRCGGDRHHAVFARKERRWSHPEVSIVSGGDTWSILECRGCQNVMFVHTHWFSEDEEWGDDGPELIVHRDLYPPAPPRAKPEWASELWHTLAHKDRWVGKLHGDIYAALGTGAFELATMGIRAIIDCVVTSRVGDIGGFARKLETMRNEGLISEIPAEIINAAFNAGSAAVHR